MTDSSPNKSALSSIASAYSDSENSNEDDGNDSGNASTLGGLVESLRTSSNAQAEDEDGKNISGSSEKVTKIVRLDSGKVVKIQVSPRSAVKDGDQKEDELDDLVKDEGNKKVDEEPVDDMPDDLEEGEVKLEDTKKLVMTPSCSKEDKKENVVSEKVVEEESNVGKEKKVDKIEDAKKSSVVEEKACMKNVQEKAEKTQPIEITSVPVKIVEKIADNEIKKTEEVVVTKPKITRLVRPQLSDIPRISPKKDEKVELTPKQDSSPSKVSPISETTKKPSPKIELKPTEQVPSEKSSSPKIPAIKIAPIKPPETLVPTEKTLEDTPKTQQKIPDLLPASKKSVEISKLSPKETTPKSSPGNSDEKKTTPKQKILPPIPNLEKIVLKSSDSVGKVGPLKIKRSLIVSPTEEAKKSKSDLSSKGGYNDELREMLSKRMGSGLNISLLPGKKNETAVNVQKTVETKISKTVDTKISKTVETKISKTVETKTSKTVETKTSPVDTKTKAPRRQDLPSDLPLPRRPDVPQTLPDAPSLSKQMPPLTVYQQRLGLAQQSYQSSFANMLRTPSLPIRQPNQQHHQQQQPQQRKVSPIKIMTPKPDAQRVVPGIVIRKMEGDGQRKVVPVSTHKSPESRMPGALQSEIREKLTMRVMAHAAESKRPLAMTFTTQPKSSTAELADASSSGSDIQTSSTSSQENSSSLPGGDVDFENVIGSSIVSKEPDTPKIEVPPPVTSTPEITPTPRRGRGRPRKITQTPLVDSSLQDGSEGNKKMAASASTPVRGRRGRLEQPLFLQPRKRKKRAEKEDDDDDYDDVRIHKLNKKKMADDNAIKRDDDATLDGSEKDESLLDESDIKQEDSITCDDMKMEDADVSVGDGTVKIRVPRKKKRRRGPFYVKRKPRIIDPNKKKEKENFQNFEEETRMSASEALHGDESLGSSFLENPRNTGNKKGRMEIFTEGVKPITVQQIVEYPWPPANLLPPGEKPEIYMIQEQISEYLGVKSFKRKYPTLRRRAVDMEERNYLQENGYVTENMCDMGLTAVECGDIMEIMCNEFPHKYDEYRKFSKEKKAREQKALREKQAAERADMDPRQEAVESASSWNADFNKTRREKRSHFFDLQSFTVNVPRKGNPPSYGRIGNYPLALIPGQTTDYYKQYTPAELKYFPLNTVLYGPMRPNERYPHEMDGSDGSGSDTDSSSSSDDSSTSSSGDSQDSSSSDEDEETPQTIIPVLPTTPKIVNHPIPKFGPKARVRLAVRLDKIDSISPVKIEPVKEVKEVKETREVRDAGPRKCKKCGGDEEQNKESVYERLIACSFCRKFWHPSCLGMSAAMVCRVESYKWQCSGCKVCVRCQKPSEASKMVFCDNCDRGHHTFCIGLESIPVGTYICCECTPPEPMKIHVKAEKLREQLTAPLDSHKRIGSVLMDNKSPAKKSLMDDISKAT